MEEIIEKAKILTEALPYIKEFNGIKLTIGYKITNKATGELCCTGESRHCFLKNGKPISLKKEAPKFYDLFNTMPREEK